MTKKDVVVSVRGVQTAGNEEDVMELEVVGTLQENDGGFVLEYTEYDTDDDENRTVIVTRGNNFVSMTKFGELTTEMIFESDTRHTCNYVTPYGDITMGVYTNTAEVSLTADGGNILLDYNIDFNTGFAANNRLAISVSPGKGEDKEKV